jgi:hypothetical protein
VTVAVAFLLGCVAGFLGCVALLFSFWRRARRSAPMDLREVQLEHLRRADLLLARALGWRETELRQ